MKTNYVRTGPTSEVCIQNEDAFPEANRCAGQFVDVATILAGRDEQKVKIDLDQACDHYRNIFDAFLYGVQFGRNNPRKM